MADSSKTVSRARTGSSRLELPTTQKRGSSVTLKPEAGEERSVKRPEGPIADQVTAISTEPLILGPKPRSFKGNMAQALIGAELMHFRVEQFVGGGGMGAVFRGRDTSLGRTVAIKVLAQEHVDADMVRRFRHEAQSAAKLDHPAIPHVYYVGEQDGWYFIVFEFIEGNNIRDFVDQQGPLSIRQTVSYLADIAEALQHASSRDVVHRDIKPSNVLVSDEGHAKLVDMGLARTEQVQSTANELTATGVTLGTFDYISPEQGRDPRDADTRSDIYSLGCTLYFMLTGRPPFPDGTMLQKLLSHTTDAPPSPDEFRGDVPPKLTEIMSRMLAKKPEHRYQDANDLLGDIVLLADDLGVALSRSRPVRVVVERPVVGATGWRSHIPWAIPLIVLVFTALLLHFWPFQIDSPPVFGPADTSDVRVEGTEGSATSNRANFPGEANERD